MPATTAPESIYSVSDLMIVQFDEQGPASDAMLGPTTICYTGIGVGDDD